MQNFMQIAGQQHWPRGCQSAGSNMGNWFWPGLEPPRWKYANNSFNKSERWKN